MRLGTSIDTDQPIDDVVASARAAKDAGFSTVWSSQIFGVDALTVLAVVAREVDGIEFGTGVIPVHPRHPQVLAQQALTVQAISKGRLTLGIGLSHQVVVEGLWGYSFDAPGDLHARVPRRARPDAARRDGRTSTASQVQRDDDRAGRARRRRRHRSSWSPRSGRRCCELAAHAHRRHRDLDDRHRDAARLHRADDHARPPTPPAAPRPRSSRRCRCAARRRPRGASSASTRRSRSTRPCRATRRCSTRRAPRARADVALVGSKDQIVDALGELAAAGVTEMRSRRSSGPPKSRPRPWTSSRGSRLRSRVGQRGIFVRLNSLSRVSSTSVVDDRLDHPDGVVRRTSAAAMSRTNTASSPTMKVGTPKCACSSTSRRHDAASSLRGAPPSTTVQDLVGVRAGLGRARWRPRRAWRAGSPWSCRARNSARCTSKNCSGHVSRTAIDDSIASRLVALGRVVPDVGRTLFLVHLAQRPRRERDVPAGARRAAPRPGARGRCARRGTGSRRTPRRQAALTSARPLVGT